VEPRAWLERHPFLGPLAALQDLVERGPAPAALPDPRFSGYAADHAAGVPLLASEAAGLDVLPAVEAGVRALLDRLEGAPAAAALRGACAELRPRLAGPGAADVLRGALAGTPPGLLPWLAWSALRPALAPVLRAFDAWRGEAPSPAPLRGAEEVRGQADGWRRPTCPTCGALPAMAHLVAAADGRQRLLSCGCCGTRWRYQRIGCPFCGNENPQRLDALEIDGEAGFRLDACGDCRGYTKTWLGEGDDAFALADWTTLHLDALAREHGLARAGPCLWSP
jgi:FdhE protein